MIFVKTRTRRLRVNSDMDRHTPQSASHPARQQGSCATCSLNVLCLPAGLDRTETERIDRVIKQRTRLKRGEYLYRGGDRLKALYAVRSGFLKSRMLYADGREQVTGFHMMGDLIGLEGIGDEQHSCDTIALDEAELCDLPFAQLEDLTRDIPSLQRHFYRAMSREIVHDQGQMLLLGNMRAEERLAAFLVNLSQRFAARGYSAREFHLRMTRKDIGSYLGLKLETVSRIFARFQSEGLIEIRNRHVHIVRLDELCRLLGRAVPDCMNPT